MDPDPGTEYLHRPSPEEKKEDSLPYDEGRFDESSKGGSCGESAESLYIQDEEKKEIQQAVDSLSPEYRVLILLYHQQEKVIRKLQNWRGFPCLS